jgi:hypothetical protein
MLLDDVGVMARGGDGDCQVGVDRLARRPPDLGHAEAFSMCRTWVGAEHERQRWGGDVSLPPGRRAALVAVHTLVAASQLDEPVALVAVDA